MALHSDNIDERDLDPFENETAEFIQNPYPALKRLRERAPIYHNLKGE